jgi:hypothetical protein
MRSSKNYRPPVRQHQRSATCPTRRHAPEKCNDCRAGECSMSLNTPSQNGYDFELVTKWFAVRLTRFGLASIASIIAVLVFGQPLC